MTEIIIGCFLSAFATGLGALPILFVKKMSHKWKDTLLAFTAGIMVSATTFGLIPEALNSSNVYILATGLLLGVFIMDLLEKNIPHIELEHTKMDISFDKKAMLIIAALVIHNIPEGMSTGISFASGGEAGMMVALALGVQNMPEGLLVALFLVSSNVSKWKAFGIATLTGFVEFLSAMLGYSLGYLVADFISLFLSFAAGAMLYIVYKELIPESHGNGYERISTYAFVIGLLAMIIITSAF